MRSSDDYADIIFEMVRPKANCVASGDTFSLILKARKIVSFCNTDV